VSTHEPERENVPDTIAAPPEPTFIRRTIGRRDVIAGVSGMGLAGVFGLRQAMAQDDLEDEAGDDDDGSTTEIEVFGRPVAGERYQDFVAKLAASLGETDPAVVDTAIRDALKAMVDERFDAGEISRNLATEIKEKIDTSEAPLMAFVVGGHGMARAERIHKKRRRNRRRDERDDTGAESTGSEDSDTSADEATPTP
jgi:hypothetical protein